MLRLSGLVLAAVLAAPLAPGLTPAYAGPGEEPRSVRVRAECVGGGTIALRHTTDGDVTRVHARGHGLGNGRWEGEHRLEVGVDDTYDTALDLDADRGDLWLDFDIDDTGKAGALDLADGDRRRCFASFDELRRGTIMGSATDSIAVWHPDPRRFVTRGQVDCRPGSRWKVMVEVGFGDWGFGGGSAPHRCNRLGFFRFAQEVRSGDPAGAPVTLGYVGRNLDTGAVRRLSWRASSPAS